MLSGTLGFLKNPFSIHPSIFKHRKQHIVPWLTLVLSVKKTMTERRVQCNSNTRLFCCVSVLSLFYEPQISAGLVLKHDWHITPSIEVTASDVDDGSPRDWPPAGRQLHDLWDLDINKHKLGGSEVNWEVNWSRANQWGEWEWGSKSANSILILMH